MQPLSGLRARYVWAMLTLISCRQSSTCADQFGPHLVAGQKEFFEGGPLGQPILVHGYNRTEAQVAQDYTAFSAALAQDCALYSWPGGCHPLDFLAAVGRAELAGWRLRDVFSMRHLRSCGEKVVTHSLGARVALAALKGGAFRIQKLILMGAAVDWSAFERGAEFENVPACCDSVHVLYSNRDDILKLAFPFGDWGGDCHALGLDGPRDPAAIPSNVQLHDLSHCIGAHSDYLSRPECCEIVRQILAA